jgi:hypothetical protein
MTGTRNLPCSSSLIKARDVLPSTFAGDLTRSELRAGRQFADISRMERRKSRQRAGFFMIILSSYLLSLRRHTDPVKQDSGKHTSRGRVKGILDLNDMIQCIEDVSGNHGIFDAAHNFSPFHIEPRRKTD